MGRVASLWRYPIKAIGRERVEQTKFIAGQTMPGDRIWAVAHQKSAATDDAWATCGNFLRACNIPALQAVTLKTDADGQLTLDHPDSQSLQVAPDQSPDALINWLSPLLEGTPFQAARVVSVPDRGMTDAPFPSVTLCNHASHKAISQRAGLDLSIHRWRGNLWLEDLAPWEEFDWIGRELAIGDAQFRVIERTGRCKATHVNPDTGVRDVDIMSVLEEYGHTDFSVQAEVTQGGLVRPGDEVRIL